MATRRSIASQDKGDFGQYNDDGSSTICMEDELESKYGVHKEKKEWKSRFGKKMKETCSCSGPKAKRILFRKIPILDWLPKYNVRRDLVGDIVAGLTVGIVHLPQGMAYADLAALPPVYGLYVSFFPALIFMLLGTSRHVSMGTYAVVSIMVGNVISDRSADQCNTETAQSGTISPTSATTQSLAFPETTTDGNGYSACENRKLELAIAIAMANGLLQILMSISRLGIVTTYLSTHLISGFTCGAAFHVLTSQISKLLGLDVGRKSGAFSLIYTYIEIFQKITQTNWATVIVSICCIIFLVIGKEINRRYHDKLPVAIPWELGVVIFATIGSYFGDLNGNYGVAIVGDIPTGIRTSVPNFTIVGQVIVDAIAIAIVAFATEISLAQMFSEKHSYKIDADQELLALGAGNVVGSFFCCFPAATSLSRSVIWEEAGAKTQLTGAFSSTLLLFVLFWIGPLFETVPSAALASIIVVNLKGMLRQFEKIPPLWRVSKIDAIIWLVTWAMVVLIGVSVGLGIAVVFEIFTVVVRAQIMNGAVMGKVGGIAEYRPKKEYHTEEDEDGIVIFQYPGPLIFANKVRFQKQINHALGFDPALASKKKKKKSGQKSDKALTLRNDAYNEDKGEDGSDVTEVKIAIDKEPESHATGDTKEDELSTISYKPKRVSHLILDMSCCPYVDNDGAQIIKKVWGTLKKVDIQVYVACCCGDIRRALSLVCDGKPPPFYVSIDSALEIAKLERSNADSSSAYEENEREIESNRGNETTAL